MIIDHHLLSTFNEDFRKGSVLAVIIRLVRLNTQNFNETHTSFVVCFKQDRNNPFVGVSKFTWNFFIDLNEVDKKSLLKVDKATSNNLKISPKHANYLPQIKLQFLTPKIIHKKLINRQWLLFRASLIPPEPKQNIDLLTGQDLRLWALHTVLKTITIKYTYFSFKSGKVRSYSVENN